MNVVLAARKWSRLASTTWKVAQFIYTKRLWDRQTNMLESTRCGPLSQRWGRCTTRPELKLLQPWKIQVSAIKFTNSPSTLSKLTFVLNWVSAAYYVVWLLSPCSSYKCRFKDFKWFKSLLFTLQKRNKAAQKRRDVSLSCKNWEHHKLTRLSASQDGKIIFVASKAKTKTSYQHRTQTRSGIGQVENKENKNNNSRFLMADKTQLFLTAEVRHNVKKASNKKWTNHPIKLCGLWRRISNKVSEDWDINRAWACDQ